MGAGVVSVDTFRQGGGAGASAGGCDSVVPGTRLERVRPCAGQVPMWGRCRRMNASVVRAEERAG